jgi:hypothetical protein
MTRRHAALETTLKALADDFANRVALAMVRAPVTELGAAFDAGELRRALLAAFARLTVERKPETRPPVRRRRREVPGSRVVVSKERDSHPIEDRGAGAITDPSLLLLAMEQERRVPVSQAPPPRADVTRSVSAGPTLRPGERLQRTTGGGLVLRRPGK